MDYIFTYPEDSDSEIEEVSDKSNKGEASKNPGFNTIPRDCGGILETKAARGNRETMNLPVSLSEGTSGTPEEGLGAPHTTPVSRDTITVSPYTITTLGVNIPPLPGKI